MRDSDVLRNIKLTYPIPYKTDDGNEIDIHEIKIGRLKAKHLDSFPDCITKPSNNGGGKQKIHIVPKEFIPFIAAVSELPIDTIKELDLNDLISIADILADSMGIKEKGK
jgi:hypothetical protein